METPKTLNDVLNKAGCSTVQMAAIDGFLGSIEAHVMNLCLAAKGLQSLAAGGLLDVPAQAMQQVGWEVLEALRKHRASIAHCRLIAPSSAAMN